MAAEHRAAELIREQVVLLAKVYHDRIERAAEWSIQLGDRGVLVYRGLDGQTYARPDLIVPYGNIYDWTAGPQLAHDALLMRDDQGIHVINQEAIVLPDSFGSEWKKVPQNRVGDSCDLVGGGKRDVTAACLQNVGPTTYTIWPNQPGVGTS